MSAFQKLKMAANKKRKLEEGAANSPASPVMSAFAARKLMATSDTPSAPSGSPSPAPAPAPASAPTPVPAPESKQDEPRNESIEAVSQRPATRRRGKRQPVVDEQMIESETQSPRPKSTTPVQTLPEAKGRSSTPYSTFRPTKRNYQRKANGRARIHAAEGERLVIIGSFGINICEGEASMAGAVFFASDKIHWVHAPYCHALPVIRATASNTVIELHPHPAAQGLRQLAKLNPAFGKLWNESADKVDSTFEIMYTSEDAPKRAILQQLVSPAEWNKKLAGIIASKQKRTPVIFVCGPKSSGKSTFGRLLANRLVTDQGDSSKKPWSSVLVLDLDPGQPEYGPPGVISLNRTSTPTLSPPFCHPTLDPAHSQLRAHAIASVSPALDPQHFVECALDLLSTYRRSINAKHPLVINTPGWIQGTGLDILAEMVKEMRPTEVIYMSQDGPDETVDSLKSACSTSIPFSTLPSQPSENTPRTALHLRTMQTMSYFHLTWASLAGAYQTWNPTPLTELRPWRVRYSGGADRGFIGILFYDHQPAPDLVTEAINGMILALVRVESKAAFRDLINQDSSDSAYAEASEQEGDPAGSGPSSRGSITRSTEGIPLIQNPQGRTLSPRHSRVLGLVLVRGVDTARGELQLLTPLPAEVVAEAGGELVLVAGKFDTPSWAYAEELHRKAAGGAVVVAPIEEDEEEADGQVVEESESDEEEEQESRRDVSKAVGASQSEIEIPWVEMLHGSQKRSVGSRVWRVRRDLGRN